jgi:hypothetical protein
MDYRIVTGRDTSDLKALQDEIVLPAWPEFMLHDACVNKYWDELHRRFPEYQFVLLEKTTERVLAVGNSMPLTWDGDPKDLPDEGLDWALQTCFESLAAKNNYRTQGAFQIVVASDLLGKGLSYEVVKLMMDIGREKGLDKLIAPVRPNMKSRYPLTPMEHYIGWLNEEGQPFDGWMRVHSRLGADTVKVCPRSMLIEGTVRDWEEWTGMRFLDSGQYVVPGALVPIGIDTEADKGTYVEPNVWMAHRL